MWRSFMSGCALELEKGRKGAGICVRIYLGESPIFPCFCNRSLLLFPTTGEILSLKYKEIVT
jgi:hypothetical protein